MRRIGRLRGQRKHSIFAPPVAAIPTACCDRSRYRSTRRRENSQCQCERTASRTQRVPRPRTTPRPGGSMGSMQTPGSGQSFLRSETHCLGAIAGKRGPNRLVPSG
jgi:hypothetical protein